MKKFVFASFFALSSIVCVAAETSVVNHGTTEPAAAITTATEAPAACDSGSCETTHCRRGIVRRAAVRSANACRAVGRAIVRPFGRVFGNRRCCR
jgi:hypothetical protein